MTVSPRISLIHPPRIFHSLGTVQSNTSVPVGTSCTVISGTSSRIISNDCLNPSPVILRQIGNNLPASAYIYPPSLFTLNFEL